MAEHKIVVASVKAGTAAAAVQALVAALGIPEETGKQIISSVPIVILDKLTPQIATNLLAALAPVRQAGANLSISAAPPGTMPHIDWPSPPPVYGHPISSYAAGAPPAHPATPAAPAAPPAPRPAPAAQQAPAAPADAGTNEGVMDLGSFECPHCGGTIYLHAVAGAGGAQAAFGSGPRQAVSDLPPALPPEALPEVPVMPGPAQPAKPPSGGIRTGPMDLEEFERGVGGGMQPQPTGDDLLRQLDASLPMKDPGLRALESAPPPAPPPAQPAQPPKPPAPPPKGGQPRRRRPGTGREGREGRGGQGRRRR